MLRNPPDGKKFVSASVYVLETNRYDYMIAVDENLSEPAAKDKIMYDYENGEIHETSMAIADHGVSVPTEAERRLGNSVDVVFTIHPHPLTKKKNHAEALRHWEKVIRAASKDPHANDIADLIADKAHDLETDIREKQREAV